MAATRTRAPSGTLMAKMMIMNSSAIGASIIAMQAGDVRKPRTVRRSLSGEMPTGRLRSRASTVALKTRSPRLRSSRKPAACNTSPRTQSRNSITT